jgi:hypothetical protein
MLLKGAITSYSVVDTNGIPDSRCNKAQATMAPLTVLKVACCMFKYIPFLAYRIQDPNRFTEKNSVLNAWNKSSINITSSIEQRPF